MTEYVAYATMDSDRKNPVGRITVEDGRVVTADPAVLSSVPRFKRRNATFAMVKAYSRDLMFAPVGKTR